MEVTREQVQEALEIVDTMQDGWGEDDGVQAMWTLVAYIDALVEALESVSNNTAFHGLSPRRRNEIARLIAMRGNG